MTEKKFLALREACEWASSYLGRRVTESNISYLIQYGKIRRYDEKGALKTSSNGVTKVSLSELKRYYDSVGKERRWKEFLGGDINWHLSFDNIRESERTKHVHRLHPYKGKFIPQLVEYFLNNQTNDFKKNVFFHEGDIILDPFVGSGTTLVQCLELGIHSIGIDVSKFNCMISEVKTRKYDLVKLSKELRKAAKATARFSEDRFWHEPKASIDQLLSSFNERYYPVPNFKILLGRIREYQSKIEAEIKELSKGDYKNRQGIVEDGLRRHEDEMSTLENEILSFLDRNSVPLQFTVDSDSIKTLANKFAGEYAEIVLQRLNERIKRLLHNKQTRLSASDVEPFADSPFLSTWFTKRQRLEMQHYLDQIHRQPSPGIAKVMKIILSRTARSCRATKHVDLATLIKPQFEPYYCRKHFKICRPVTTIIRHLRRYTEDTIKRIRLFSKLRRNTFYEVINADSKTVDIFDSIAEKNEEFHRLLTRSKIDGIFTSPPYVGQIDYHEQHAYAYELFKVERKDELEIGRMSNGVSQRAQKDYIVGISRILLNMKNYLKKNAHIFVVANDSKNLYPVIAKTSGLRIIETFRRPVLNRTERDKQPYSEAIFHMVFK